MANENNNNANNAGNNNKANNNKANNNKANNNNANNNKANNTGNNNKANNNKANNTKANNNNANNNKANNTKANNNNANNNKANNANNNKANNAGNGNKVCATCVAQANFPNKKVMESKYEDSIPIPEIGLIRHVDLDLGEKFGNRCVFYWAALPASSFANRKNGNNKNGNNKHPNCNKAYGDYCNRGIVKTDCKGKAHLCIEMPVVYKVDGKEYKPHMHFIVESSNGDKWLQKQYTVEL